ncbi:hypothetical protein ACJ72_07777 [Emergomyces africanus]|uniref:Uncharacterized protein n=1 Tax=Emergomyces africanus TaxID=1955775 RepID=A0A1B7NM58_9EURO|nr:hypothetical protein ACJ72_07777 [Emergomyces africanus]
MSNYYCNGFTLEALWARLDHEEKWSISGSSPTFLVHSDQLNPHVHSQDTEKSLVVALHVAAKIHEASLISDWSLRIRSNLQEDHQMVMTYANLHPRNIMIRPGRTEAMAWSRPQGSKYEFYDRVGARREWRVTCLVNWQRGGVYPEYWEYVKALNPADTAGCPLKWWYYLPRSIGVWPVEHAADKLIVVP